MGPGISIHGELATLPDMGTSLAYQTGPEIVSLCTGIPSQSLRQNNAIEMNASFSKKMTSLERRATLSLGAIYATRMFGLFMILPVFAIYAEQLENVTPVLIGLAIGAYGLTQALFQVPLGMLSDRVGRKPVIVGGLLLFALGSVIAAMSISIYGVIAGRALQGAGAIAAAVMALAADLTREEHRTKVMAAIGLSIGMSFSLVWFASYVLVNGYARPKRDWNRAHDRSSTGQFAATSGRSGHDLGH